MSTEARILPKAFAVWFKDLHLWSVNSFVSADWHWPTEDIKPLRMALRRKLVEVDKKQRPLEEITLATLRFDGTIEPRAQNGLKEFKGKLFQAAAGDVVYSKIDVRNGAIGIVPAELGEIAVSNEFPVYEVSPEVADSEFIKLLFRTKRFRQIVNGMISGASGRKRVQPTQLEDIEAPLPPLAVQRAIVARWLQAKEEAESSEARIAEMTSRLERKFLEELGIELREEVERPKYFAVLWKDLPRWSVRFVTDFKLGLDRSPHAEFAFVTLGQVAQISYGIQKSPANRPAHHVRPYMRVANVRKGYLDLSEIKTIDVPDEEMDMYRLLAGDILFVEGNGSRSELGRVAIWNDEIPNCVHQNHLIKVRTDKTQLLPEFAMTWFNTELGRGHFFRAAKTSSGLGTINSEEVRNAPIPLPPLEVQREIVRRVEEGRAEIAREREAAAKRAREAEEEVEALILGAKKLAA
jgi:type I restriction enzyme S subunit